MSKPHIKRTVDMQVIGEWIDPEARVLDLGCGRGVLLEYLVHTKHVHGIGVDLDVEKIGVLDPADYWDELRAQADKLRLHVRLIAAAPRTERRP